MRQLAPILALTFTLSSPVLAEDLAANATVMPPSGIPFNTSISLNLPLTATDSTGRQAEEDSHLPEGKGLQGATEPYDKLIYPALNTGHPCFYFFVLFCHVGR